MSARPLHIAWLGPAPGEDGGVSGVGCDLLHGLTALGHRIDCFFPSSGQPIPQRLAGREGLTFNWGTSKWEWDRWYSRGRIAAFASGMLARGLASLRLRRQILAHHRRDPFDVVYQFSTIESPAVPARLTRTVPLVIHPETHSAGELRWMIAERKIALRCQPAHRLLAAAAVMLVRSLVQRVAIRRARLLICISAVFRDHIVRDYGFPAERTAVVPNPVRLERFVLAAAEPATPARLLVLGRVAVRKGVDDVVALARELLRREVPARIRIVGNPSLWSDYTPLLAELPTENADYAGAVTAAEIPGELSASDVLLQVSRYEPFALTVAEALASGVPVLATTEVGAVERVDPAVAVAVPPRDVEAMCSGLVELLDRLRREPHALRALCRAEAERLFAADVVCAEISQALARLPGLDAGAPAPARRRAT